MYFRYQFKKTHNGKIVPEAFEILDKAPLEVKMNECVAKPTTTIDITGNTVVLFEDCVFYFDCGSASLEIVSSAAVTIRKNLRDNDARNDELNRQFKDALKKAQLDIYRDYLTSRVPENGCSLTKIDSSNSFLLQIPLKNTDALGLKEEQTAILEKLAQGGIKVSSTEVEIVTGRVSFPTQPGNRRGGFIQRVQEGSLLAFKDPQSILNQIENLRKNVVAIKAEKVAPQSEQKDSSGAVSSTVSNSETSAIGALVAHAKKGDAVISGASMTTQALSAAGGVKKSGDDQVSEITQTIVPKV